MAAKKTAKRRAKPRATKVTAKAGAKAESKTGAKRGGKSGGNDLGALAKVAPSRRDQTLALPSGRSIAYAQRGGREELEVRSATGMVELRIALTPDGPVLSLSGVRLEINSTDSVAVRCREFEVDAREGVLFKTAGDVAIGAAGEMRVKTRGQMHMDAELIHLNGGDRTGYPDEETAKMTQAIVERTLAARGQLPSAEAHEHHEGCDHG
jgi:hypothetical protein